MKNNGKNPKLEESKDLEQLIDKEVITVEDSSKNYYDVKSNDQDWEMSAIDALQVNYLTRTNRSVKH